VAIGVYNELPEDAHRSCDPRVGHRRRDSVQSLRFFQWAAAAYCSTCGTPLLHDDLPVPHVGTRTLTGERLLAAYVIPGILITLFCWIPGLIGIALAIDAYGKLRRGDVEGADGAAWKARIALAIGAVIIGVSWLAPVAGRLLDFLTSL
jgi:hypothetical protein